MTTHTTAPPTRRFGRGFATWLGASTIAATGDGILFFAIGWTAAGLGGATAGMLMTLVVLPRTLLMLVGGAAGDRWGPRRTIIGCDAFMCLVLLGYLVADRTPASTTVLLVGLALCVGVATAFRYPAAGAFPRLFAAEENLPRVMSLTGSVLQVARLAGPPLGGIVVAALGMTGAITVNLATFLVILLVLLVVRPPYEPDEARAGSTLRSIADGLRAALRLPGIPALLGSVAVVAGGVIPMLSICVPVAARARGWSAGATGLVEALWIVGTLSTTLLVVRYGTRARAIGPLMAGPLLSAAGAGVVALAANPALACAGALVMGVGTAAFTTHALPLYVLRTPDGMLARFQALLGLVQSVPMLAINGPLGAVAAHGEGALAIGLMAGFTALASVLVCASPAVRGARLPGAGTASGTQSR